jgi:RND family efflux transporter MFP subunit
LTSNSQLENTFVSQRQLINTDLPAWETELNQLKTTSDPTAVEAEIIKSQKYLIDIRTYLTDASDMVTASVNLTPAAINGYKASLNISRATINGAANSINAIGQSLSAQKIAIDQAQKQLDLKLAGSRKEDIDAQAARVAQAQAALDAINLQIYKSALRSPINGIASRVDAKVGAISSPSLPIVSIISNTKFEIETRVAEDAVAKIKIGDNASVTLDAFGEGRNFDAKIISIDPSPSTDAKGVSGYRLRLQFVSDNPDIKNGMTANVKIITETKLDALYLPSAAVIRQDFDYYVTGPDKQNHLIKVGLTGSDGKIEIVSGLNEGDQVLMLGQ